VLILLPPSEGKESPKAGDPVDLDSLAFAEQLRRPRERLLDALAGLAEVPLERAVEMLAISSGQAGDVGRDAVLRAAPAAPAADVYTGVLYDRLDLAGLPVGPRRRAEERLLIASALWGLLRPGDRIPYYRLSAKARLDGIGASARFWREPLAAALPDEAGELVVDMRSGAYAAAWRPRNATLLGVRAFTVKGGERKPVSHMAKAVRGEVARALLLAEGAPREPEEAASIASDAGFEVELTGGTLDVIIRD
jgi:cytoplasmic iron level regulating protein YaaA (DUF328/UPF0246 family)